MRTARKSAAPLQLSAQPNSDRWSKAYTIDLLTPLVGGGTTSWKVDSKQPIRTSEIKQQLRFWWRTMQDSAPDLRQMLDEERRLFGHTDRASPVRLSITATGSGQPKFLDLKPTGKSGRQFARQDFAGNNLPKYVLFPIAETPQDAPYKLLLQHRFKLHISGPTGSERTVEDALTLWLLFGGLGARTRRGAGSVWCKEINDAFTTEAEVIAFIKQMTQKHPPPVASQSAAFPVLSGGRLALAPVTSSDAQAAVKAWGDLLENHGNWQPNRAPGFGDLRQAVGLARPNGEERPGRSRWPEPDAIRRNPGPFDTRHQPRKNLPNWYPRGAYGLPIQFKFGPNPRGDPADIYHLIPQGGDTEGRWPSPLTLKIARIGGKLYKVGLLLNHRIPTVALHYAGTEHAIPLDQQPGKVPSPLPRDFPEMFPLGRNDPYSGLFAKLFPKPATIHDL